MCDSHKRWQHVDDDKYTEALEISQYAHKKCSINHIDHGQLATALQLWGEYNVQVLGCQICLSFIIFRLFFVEIALFADKF